MKKALRFLEVTVALALWTTLVTASSPCPNGTSTCIQHDGGGHVCCPYLDGTCCSDGLHCCPANEQCHLDRGLCVSVIRPWQLPMRFPTLRLHSMVPLLSQSRITLKCDDTHMINSCLGDITSTTCCPSPYIGNDCCPLRNGICCGDFLHCCPENTNCDVENGQCIAADGSNETVPYYRKTKPVSFKKDFLSPAPITKLHDLDANNIKCLDNVTVCYDSDTCCSTGGGSYGCCPIPNAVCCDDLRNCCPSGMICETRTGNCIRQNGQRFRGLSLLSSIIDVPIALKSINKLEVGSFRVAEKSVIDMKFYYDGFKSIQSSLYVTLICPGGQYSCPDWMTCCASSDEEDHGDIDEIKYSCCPFSNAVCCSDEKHCCPHGTTCDLTKDLCVDGHGNFAKSFKKIDSKKAVKVRLVCPDQSTCPASYTCCQLPAGGYGCCPYSQAVCCDDHVHCCPQGSVCDTQARGCRKENDVTVEPFKEIYSKNQTEEVIICPGGKYMCPDHDTCCKTTTGQYGCCPLETAVCCKDGKRCCPHGTTCDPTEQRCIATPTTDNP